MEPLTIQFYNYDGYAGFTIINPRTGRIECQLRWSVQQGFEFDEYVERTVGRAVIAAINGIRTRN